MYWLQTKFYVGIPGENAPKDKHFTKLHRAVCTEDIDKVKKYVKIDPTSMDYADKVGSIGKKRLKLAATNFVGTGNTKRI